MKVREIIRQVNDEKIYFELKHTEKEGGGTLGIYTKKELHYNDNLNRKTINSINVQYYNSKRLLVLEIK